MSSIDLQLSVEEVAFILSTTDQPDMAHDLMIAQLGDMGQAEARARLLAAGHSLLARAWVNIDESDQVSLSEPIERLAHILTCADFSIRYDRAYRPFELTLTFHFVDASIFSHSIEDGVIHHITEVQGETEVLRQGLTFFAVEDVNADCPVAEIPYSVLEQIKDEENLSTILSTLQKWEVPEKTRRLFTEDLRDVQYRGSVMRVDYEDDSRPRSDEGLLVLRGPDRLWFLRPFVREEKDYIKIFPGSIARFYKEVAAIL
jgi:hypothetical protein